MQDVAQAAGVCRATVCLALRNDPQLPVATRRRIQRLARQLGYRPNPLVAALMANLGARRPRAAAPTIAYVTDSFERDEQLGAHPYHRAMFEGARGRAEALGFRVEPFFIPPGGMTPRRLSGVLYARRINGLLVAPLRARPATLDFKWEWFSVASIGAPMAQTPLHAAENHQYHSMRLALRELGRLGYRRVGLVLQEHWNLRLDEVWTASYASGESQKPARDRLPWLCPAVVTAEAFRAWFKRHRPEAIISPEMQIVNWLGPLGLRVLRDVGLCHMGIPPGDRTYSGLDQNPSLIGAAAADLIIEQMYHNETGLPAKPKTLLIESNWVVGRTLRRRSHHALLDL